MIKYHKIYNVFNRNMNKNSEGFGKLIEGDYKKPVFEYLAPCKWVGTEKVDGTNIRVLWNREYNETLEFRGKSDKAQFFPGMLDRLESLFSAAAMFDRFNIGNEVCLYGEGYGAGIQKGAKYREHKDFVLFDVKINDSFLPRQEVEYIAAELKIDIVPEVITGTLPELVEYVKSEPKSTWGDFTMEGLVARPAYEIYDEHHERIITKIKCCDF